VSNRIFLHVDINSYFATLLQQETPSLRGKPVGVLKEAGRGCVIAASKEAKQFGVKTGCRAKDAKLLCPHIQFIPANFDMYLSATRQLRDLFLDLSPDIQIFSLDEAFLEFTALKNIYPSAYIFGQLVQKRIKETLGEWVTCNVGIAQTKILAKLTSEVSPKNSITEVTEDNKSLLLSTVNFADVCGVGYRLEKKLLELGVRHPYQINFLSQADLEKHFGPFWSVQLQKIAQGEDPHFLVHQRDTPHMKSVSRSITGFKLARTEAAVQQVIYNLCAEVMYKTRKMNLAGRHVGISLTGTSSPSSIFPDSNLSNQDTTIVQDGWNRRTHRQAYWSSHKTSQQYIQHTQELYSILYDEMASHRPEQFPVIRFRVSLSLLKPITQIPQVLWEEWWKKEQVEQACDEISKKYGLFTVRSGRLHAPDLIRPEVTGFFGDQSYYFD